MAIAHMVSAQGIAAEIPQADRREAEELERKARSPHSGDAPKNRTGKQDLKLNTAISRVCQTHLPYRRPGVKPAGGLTLSVIYSLVCFCGKVDYQFLK
jgi:hypothetical protein